MIVALDIAVLVLMLIIMSSNGFDFSLMGVIAALVADVTLGLAIHGKYADKKAAEEKCVFTWNTVTAAPKKNI